MNNDEIKKKIEEILFSQIRFYDKFGGKCPYCSFEVPSHYREQNKPRSLATHMGKQHPEKTPNKVNLLTTLFTEMVEGELKGFADWLAMNTFMADSTTMQPEETINKWRFVVKQYLLERNKK